MSPALDHATQVRELRHLRVLIRRAGLAFDQLPEHVRDGIDRTGGPDELARLVPMLAGLSTAVRDHLEVVVTAALVAAGYDEPFPVLVPTAADTAATRPLRPTQPRRRPRGHLRAVVAS